MSSIGLMDGAFFVGRKDLVDWVNNTLELSITKIEDTAFGGIACQFFDIMYPGVVAMHKVDWTAKQSFEFVNNYKVLQAAFSKAGVEKHIDVDRLIKGRYQDNLEFMQWFKRFFEMHVQDKGDYDCEGQRSKGKGGSAYIYGPGGKGTTAKTTTAPKPVVASTSKATGVTPLGTRQQAKQETVKAPSTEVLKAAAPSKVEVNTHSVSTVTSEEVIALRKSVDDYKYKYDETARELSESKIEIEDLSKERDFYFDKLREVEIALQELVDNGHSSEVTKEIFKILYATAEGFEVQNPEDLPVDAQEES